MQTRNSRDIEGGASRTVKGASLVVPFKSDSVFLRPEETSTCGKPSENVLLSLVESLLSDSESGSITEILSSCEAVPCVLEVHVAESHCT